MASDVTRGVGLRIRALRVAQGLTLVQLGRRVGLTPGALSYVESGKRGCSVDKLAQVARGLDVGVATLLSTSALESDMAAPLLRAVRDNRLGREQVAHLVEEARRLGAQGPSTLTTPSGMYVTPLAEESTP